MNFDEFNVRYLSAMVRLFSKPDPEIFDESHGTVYLSELVGGRDGLRVVPVMAIHSLVCMFPESKVNNDRNITHTGKYALMRLVLLWLEPMFFLRF